MTTTTTTTNTGTDTVHPVRSCDDGKAKRSVKPPSKIQLFLIVIIGNLCTGAQYSIQAPFYPRMAQQKGLTQTQFGFVFGIYSLGIVAFSPIVGKLLPVVYPKFLIYIGLFINGYASILFGMLQWSPRGGTFLGLSLLLRLAEASGSAAFSTSVYTMCAISSLDNFAQYLAAGAMAFGVGMIIGPVFGGLLYEFGGFHLPFLVLGSCCILCSAFVSIVLPDLQRVKEQKKVSMTRMLFKMPIAVNLAVGFTALVFTGYNQATLEHHVREVADLSPLRIGFIFLLLGLTYGICTQIFAYITKKLANLYWLLAVGILTSSLCFVLGGPLHGIPLESSIGLIVAGQIALGIGSAITVIVPYTQIFKEAMLFGYKDMLATYSVASGLFQSSLFLGSSIGPVFGGYIVDKVGYRKATTVTLGIQVSLACLVMIYALTKEKAKDIDIAHNGEELKEVKESIGSSTITLQEDKKDCN